jgi:hypothetical protein
MYVSPAATLHTVLIIKLPTASVTAPAAIIVNAHPATHTGDSPAAASMLTFTATSPWQEGH